MSSQKPEAYQKFIPAACGAVGGLLLASVIFSRGDVGPSIWILVPVAAAFAQVGAWAVDQLRKRMQWAPPPDLESAATDAILESPRTAPQKPEFTMVHGFALIVLAFGLAVFLADCVSGSKGDPAKTESSSMNIGDTVLIASADGKGIGGAASSEAYAALQKAFLANDNEGVQELLAAGLVVIVKSGTTARYLDFEIAGPRIVRVLEGPFAGRKVWVLGDHVHKYYPSSSAK